MAIKTRAELKAENASDFPDNTARLISAADLRGQMDDIVDSVIFPEDDITGPPGPPGSDSGSVDGIAALRAIAPTSGRTLRLNYHTTPGDLGVGQFVGTTTGGPYTDNDGTIVVPTGGDGSAAWLRVWDKVRAHVGWFGAKCQPETAGGPDDYIPVKKCFDLFTSGRTTGGGYGGGTTATGIVDVGPGFNFSQPLIYGGHNGAGFKLAGHIGASRGGQEKSLLRYIGPKTLSSIIFYGANQFSIDDINTLPGLALNGIAVIADNTYNNAPVGIHTTTSAITAGPDVVVTPAFAGAGTGNPAADRVQYLQPGVMLGVGGISATGGAVAGADFEIVYITAVDTVAGTFTATFAKNHASGAMLGGSTPSSGGRVNRCRLLCSQSPIYTKLSAAAPGSGAKTYVVEDITNILVGHPVRIGHGLYQEIVYPDSVNVGAKSFHAPTGNFSHAIGERCMYPTSAILFGNRLLGTVQVSEVAMYDTHLQGDGAYVIEGTSQTRCYAGVRQMWGGNVKNFTFHTMYCSSIKVPFAFEQPSGQYIISGGVSGGVEDTLFLAPGATITVEGWEDESACVWLVGHSTGGQATFIGCTMQGEVPHIEMIPGGTITDEIFYWGGQLMFLGCHLSNGRIWGTTLPIIACNGIEAETTFPGSVTLISSWIAGATPTGSPGMNFVRPGPGSSVDVLKQGTGKITMLNCNGAGQTSLQVRLPNVLPPLKMWEGTAAGIDPPSLAAAAVGTIGTITVSGAVLGDLVESSFSLDLNGAALRAWVSATDTVKYQFANPTAAPIDLASGTVKVRVKK